MRLVESFRVRYLSEIPEVIWMRGGQSAAGTPSERAYPELPCNGLPCNGLHIV
jgi:hypothetical protein